MCKNVNYGVRLAKRHVCTTWLIFFTHIFEIQLFLSELVSTFFIQVCHIRRTTALHNHDVNPLLLVAKVSSETKSFILPVTLETLLEVE